MAAVIMRDQLKYGGFSRFHRARPEQVFCLQLFMFRGHDFI